MSDFYSAIVFLSAFIMIIMVLLVRSNDLVEYSEKQTIYTISVLVIAGAVSEWLAVWMDGADPSLRLLHVILKTIELSTGACHSRAVQLPYPPHTPQKSHFRPALDPRAA